MKKTQLLSQSRKEERKKKPDKIPGTDMLLSSTTAQTDKFGSVCKKKSVFFLSESFGTENCLLEFSMSLMISGRLLSMHFMYVNVILYADDESLFIQIQFHI